MPRILVLYATREGQTRKIGERITQHLRNAGADVRLVDARDGAATREIDLSAFDLLVFGASMHAGGLETELVDFIKRHKGQIEPRARSLFLVLLSAATQDAKLKAKWLEDARRKMDAQLNLPFKDVEMIAGALMYSKYSLPLKWIMRRIAKQAGSETDTSRDHEYTDWEQVERYAHRLVKASNREI